MVNLTRVTLMVILKLMLMLMLIVYLKYIVVEVDVFTIF